jgi:hypothetical protein
MTVTNFLILLERQRGRYCFHFQENKAIRSSGRCLCPISGVADDFLIGRGQIATGNFTEDRKVLGLSVKQARIIADASDYKDGTLRTRMLQALGLKEIAKENTFWSQFKLKTKRQLH